MHSKLILGPISHSPNHYSYLKDPLSDLFLFLGDDIIPLHLDLVASQSPYFQRLQSRKQNQGKVVDIITKPFKTETLKKIFSIFYGEAFSLHRNQQMKEALEICLYFQLATTVNTILKDIQQNFDQFDFFMVLEMAKSLGIKNLERECWLKMGEDDFEQINYNKFEFFSSPQQIVLEVLEKMSAHHKYKSQYGEISRIVHEYASFHRKKDQSQKIIEEIFRRSAVKRSQLEIFEVEEAEEEMEGSLWASKDLSTEPSPKCFGNFSSFAEVEENFHKFLSPQENLSAIWENCSEVECSQQDFEQEKMEMN